MEDLNSHHLLQEHLYKGRKQVRPLSREGVMARSRCWSSSEASSVFQHRHRFSRNHLSINTDEDEVQEIFQRTMRKRLESFKSAKMGMALPKTISKHTKKEQQKVRAWLFLLIFSPIMLHSHSAFLNVHHMSVPGRSEWTSREEQFFLLLLFTSTRPPPTVGRG